MELLDIKIRGFMKYKELFEVKFDKETYIIGGNAKGKTSIAYAVAWAFLGTNLRGNDKVSLVNRESEDCLVELNFIDNDNIKHNLIRYKHNTYSAKNSLLLDGKPVKQENIEKFYIEKQLFLSIYNPDYFKEATPAKQKELIDKYLPDVSIKDIYNKLSKDEKEMIVFSSDIDITKANNEEINKIIISEDTNINKIIKDCSERIRDIDKKILGKKGNLEYAQKIVSEKLEDKKEFKEQEELDLLEQEKDYLETESNQEAKEKLQNKIEENMAMELNLKNKLDKINEKLKKSKSEYNKILSDPVALCPCCNQPFNSNSKSIALENKRKEMFELSEEKEKIEEQIAKFKLNVMQLKAKLYALKGKDNSSRIIEIDKRVKELKDKKELVNQFNKELEIKSKNIEKTRNDITNIIVDIENLDEEKDKNYLQKVLVEKIYCLVIQAKMEIAEKYMKNTKIQFYELVKSTGELKDCFKITRNGEEFTYLSKAQKFMTILEICNMLNKISGLNIPILIDDSESYPDFNFKFEDFNTQLIIIKAKKNRMLKVSNNEETINNFKTLRTYTKLKEYNQVA